MAVKDSNIKMMEKNKESIKKVSAKVHEELLNTSHLFIDETVATLSRIQKITGKVIKKSEPIIEKQIDMTFDTVEALKEQAEKGGKRALKLFGLTKQYNKLSASIAEKINDMPSTEEVIENAKDMVASAKSDVEETFTKATESIKTTGIFGETEKVAKKVTAKTKAVKTTAKKSVAKATKKVATKAEKASKVVATKPTPAKRTKTTTKPASKVATAAKVNKATKVQIATSELTQIKGIGPSLAEIMANNGIKSIKDLQNATPTALKVVATKAGNRYKSFDTNKWIEAAKAIK